MIRRKFVMVMYEMMMKENISEQFNISLSKMKKLEKAHKARALNTFCCVIEAVDTTIVIAILPLVKYFHQLCTQFNIQCKWFSFTL